MDHASGRLEWLAPLKGSDFVNVLVDGDRVFATTKGEIFCLEAATGRLLWHDDLPGEGWGLITIATHSGSSNLAPIREKQRQQEAAQSGDGG